MRLKNKKERRGECWQDAYLDDGVQKGKGTGDREGAYESLLSCGDVALRQEGDYGHLHDCRASGSDQPNEAPRLDVPLGAAVRRLGDLENATEQVQCADHPQEGIIPARETARERNGVGWGETKSSRKAPGGQKGGVTYVRMICDWERTSLLSAGLSLSVRNTRNASVGRP